MSAVHFFGAALIALFADVVTANTVEPLDRVVGVVAEQPIFLSELRQRARPHVFRIEAMTHDPKERAASKATMLREMLDRLIDERLEAKEAEKAHLTADPSEIDQALQHVSKQANMTPAELLAEAKRQGMAEAEYKDDIRRQILEGKLIQLRVRGRVNVTEADARKVYAVWVKETTGANAPVDLRILVLRLAPDATPAAKKQTETLAAQIATQARSGTDFCTLVTKHTEDPTTKSTCGSRGPLLRGGLMPEIREAAGALKAGETAGPIFFTDPTGSQAYLVIQRAPGAAPAVPTFDSVKEQMKERAFVEATDRERRLWIQELRKPIFIEVRL